MQFAQILFFPHTTYEKIKAMIVILPKGTDKLLSETLNKQGVGQEGDWLNYTVKVTVKSDH